MSGYSKPRLVLAEVDGTLVTNEKVLTEEAKAAARALNEAGVELAITSGRPPRGMTMLIEPLQLTSAIAGFNGGALVHQDLSVIEFHALDPAVTGGALRLILDNWLDAWIYTESRWLIHDLEAPHVARERRTVRFTRKSSRGSPMRILRMRSRSSASPTTSRESPPAKRRRKRRSTGRQAPRDRKPIIST